MSTGGRVVVAGVAAALVGALAWPGPAAAAAPDADPVTDDRDDIEIVEIVTDDAGELAGAAEIALAAGGTVVSDTPGALLVTVDADTRAEIDDAVDAQVREPRPVDVRPETVEPLPASAVPEFGPTVSGAVEFTGADEWHAAGITGAGQQIGVIDFFDVERYWDTAEHGPTPVAGVNARCFENGDTCTDQFYDGQNLGGEDHGVAVVEIVRDMAPGADIYIGQAVTVADYYELVDWFAANGVDVITRSLGSRYDGPGDGRGELDSVAEYAVSQGMLWVNSGGNNGINRYYREPVRLVGNQVAFGPSGSSTFLEFNRCLSLGGVRWANDWDKPPAQRTDYDVRVWDGPSPGAGSVIATSTERQGGGAAPVEHIFGARCPSTGNALYLEIIAINAGDGIDGDIIEILDYGGGLVEHAQVEYSASTSVVASKSSGVIGVGAIDPGTSGEVGAYSSQGPTNDERVAPALVAPSGFYNSVFRSAFSGTSASSPLVAGGAALLRAGGVATGPGSLGDVIRSTAIDRGSSGPDSVYGHGEFTMPAPPDDLSIDETPSQFVASPTPVRLLDTRTASAIGPDGLIGDLRSGEVRDLPVLGTHGVPSDGVTAVAVNLTATGVGQPGFVQAVPTGRSTIGSYSNINIDAGGQTRANFAVIPVGDDGSISLYTTASGNLVVDLLGWFEAAPGPVAGGRFVELPRAQRALDTRQDGGSPLSTGDTRQIRYPAGIERDRISALVVTVTGTESTMPGWVQAFPSDSPATIGQTSTVNLDTGRTVANTAIVPVGAAGAAITTLVSSGGSTHVVVDVVGYITSSQADASGDGRFVPVKPGRAFDSRFTGGVLADAQIITVDGSSAPGVDIPDDASGVLWNLAAVSMQRPGYLRAWATGTTEPATSALNWSSQGEVRAGAVISAVIDGRANFRVDDGAANLPDEIGHLLADVFGYFT